MMDAPPSHVLPRPAQSGVVYACYPHPKFPVISITGESCSLSCGHCGRKYLKHMIPCTTPRSLEEKCAEVAARGARGVLLSGGYNPDGYVPFEPFLDAIERVKHETGLFISAHTGLIPGWLARELGRAGVDLADFDLVGDDETIRLALGIDRTVEDYARALRDLKRSVPYVAPHICIGLHAGKAKGEWRAIEIAGKVKPAVLVMLVLLPTSGTRFESVIGPRPEDVGEIIMGAKAKLPGTALALGCMRPRDGRRTEFEIQALRSGVSRIAIPSEMTLEAARRLGLEVRRLDACCAVPERAAGAAT